LDKQWFNSHKDVLKDALDITPTNDNNPYVNPPSSDTVIEYVNTLGYPSTLQNVLVKLLDMTGQDTLKNLATALRGKKKTTHFLILNFRFVRKDGREILEEGGETKSLKATKGTKPKAAKATKSTGDKASTLTSTQPPKSKPTPTQPSKSVPEKKQKLLKENPDESAPTKRSKGGLVGKIRKPRIPVKLVDEPSAEDVSVEEPTYNEEEANLQRALELILKEQAERTQGPARPVVIREPDSERIQPLPDVQGKGKEKVVDEQAAHDLFTLLAPKNKSPVDQFIFQRHEEFTTTAYPNVQENLKLPSKDSMIPEEPTSSTGTLYSLQNLEKELSFTDHFFVEKKQEEEPGKTNAEAKVQSMVSVPIHQDTSSVPPMTTLVIDLMTKVVDEIVTDAVDWAMQAPLQACFSNLPVVDMKEILQQQMFEDKSYEAHEDHKKLYDALKKL
nr:hypothetical protein [Tanacetum cinerariifolium]